MWNEPKLVTGNKWCNAEKGKGVVLNEQTNPGRVLVKWEEEEPTEEWLIDLNPAHNEKEKEEEG